MKSALPITLDLFAFSVDVISVVSLCLALIVGLKSVRSFRQSKQAVIESASLLNVIVDSLSSRIQRSESALTMLRSEMTTGAREGDALEVKQSQLQASYEQMTHELQDFLSNGKKVVADLEQLRERLTQIPQGKQAVEGLPRRENFAAVISEGDILAALTSTERRTLEILMAEGSKGAPELGKRLKKSREHTSRLMKKLYMEGYVNRESNHAPFRYRLNDEVRSALQSVGNQNVTEERPETF
jgi:DNA-binding MarR family transcriptional regulator